VNLVLEKLDDIAWETLKHAYGQAGDIPDAIRGLTSPDPEIWVAAVQTLYDALCHQTCTIYEATAPSIPFLFELMTDPTVRCRGNIIHLVGDMARATGFLCAHGSMSMYAAKRETTEFKEKVAQERVWVKDVRGAIWQRLEALLALLNDLNKRVRIQVPYTLGLLGKHADEEMPTEIRRQQPYPMMTGHMARQLDRMADY